MEDLNKLISEAFKTAFGDLAEKLDVEEDK